MMKKSRSIPPCQSAWSLWEARAAHCLPGMIAENPPAGVDEAGRGCLAGPVVAAAVILPRAAALPPDAQRQLCAESSWLSLAMLRRARVKAVLKRRLGRK